MPARRTIAVLALAALLPIVTIHAGASAASLDIRSDTQSDPSAERVSRAFQRLGGGVPAGDAGRRIGVPILTVGNDAGCDHLATPANNGQGLQAALDAAAMDANGAGETEIRLADTGFFSNRRLFVSDSAGGDQTVTLVGGYANCSSTAPTAGARTSITRGTATSGSLLDIDGVTAAQTVSLRNLTISGGDASGGGGIDVGNNNYVLLENVTVSSNTAANGGGIRLLDIADATETILLALDPVRIHSNSASTHGGGIFCQGSGAQILLDADVRIDRNSSGFSGGGIAARSGCVVDSYASLPGGIYLNSAGASGGGVAVWNGAQFRLIGGEVAFFGFGDASRRTSVDTNEAAIDGGGIWSSDAGTLVRVTDAYIGSNVADSDASGDGDGGGVFVNQGARLETDRTLDADDCHEALRCTNIGFNRAVNGGAIHAVGSQASIDLRQTWLNGNEASDLASVLYAGLAAGEPTSDPIEVLMEGNVIADNVLPGSGEAIFLAYGTDTTIAFTTFAGNADSEFDLMIHDNTANTIRLYSSLVEEMQGDVFNGNWTAPVNPNIGLAECVVAHEVGTMPENGPTVQQAPALLDSERRPLSTSPAVDFCDTLAWTPLEPDLENLPRGVDTVGVTNGLGPYDLGALEFRGTVDGGGRIHFVAALAEVTEDHGILVVAAERVESAQGRTTVRVTPAEQTAVVGDFMTPPDPWILEWEDGETGVRTFEIPIVDDALDEPAEQFLLTMTPETGAGQVDAPSTMIVRIFDNEQGIFADGFERGDSL